MSMEVHDCDSGAAHMTPQNLAYFEKLLNDTLDALLREAGSAVSELARGESRETEFIDLTMAHMNQSVNFRLHTRKSQLIKKVRAALRRIEEGTYGYCDICGEPISPKRLAARPVTSKCRDCKEAEERLEALVS